MAITDELREYTEEQIKWLDMTKVHYRKLFAIANRIDAEHERQLEVLYRDMSDAEYVKLPVDADGETIHIGDDMETLMRGFEGVHSHVEYITLTKDGWEVDGEPPTSMRHHHAPTVEDVLREFAGTLASAENNWGSDVDDAIADYAKRLRLAESEES